MDSLEVQDLYAALLHEMKNSLVLMSMNLERIPHMGNPGHDRPLDDVRLQCQRVAERLMQALLIYRCNLNEMALNALDAYSTQDLVQELAVQARSLRPELLVQTHISAEVPAIWFFDRNMLEIALINGLHNSMSYAKAGISIAVKVEDRMLCISIKDDSAGYPTHILDSEFGVSSSTTGTGLGLRFARLIARSHCHEGRSGCLRLRNEEGAVFELCIP